MIKKMIKQIKCKHNYVETSQKLIDAGMGKMVLWKCQKCGKEKTTFV